MIAAGDKWKEQCHEEIIRLSECGALGQSMFAGKIVDIVQKRVKDEIDKVIKEQQQAWIMYEGDKKTLFEFKHIAQWREEVMLRINEISGISSLPSKRFVDVSYRQLPVTKIAVSCLVQEVELRIWAVIKGCAVAQKLIPEMMAETILGFRTGANDNIVLINPPLVLKVVFVWVFSSCWKYFDRACCLQCFNRFFS